MDRKRVRRVMRLFGIKPYRRHGKKYRRSRAKRTFLNLLLEVMPSYPNHVWVTDFTELILHGKKVYVSTILDLFTRQLMDLQVAVRKGSALTVATLAHAIFHHPKPICPWENGYQESFYDKFKVDFGDHNRFDTLGELVAEIYRTMWEYNHERTCSALKMPRVRGKVGSWRKNRRNIV